MANRTKIIEELLQNIHAMRHKLMVGYTHEKTGAVGLGIITPSQGFVLRFVEKNNSVNIKTIAQALQITSSATTQLVDSLVEKGHLIRKNDPNDRRGISLSLSETAIKLFEEFKGHHIQKMTTLFDALTDDELAQYAQLNQKIADSIMHKTPKS